MKKVIFSAAALMIGAVGFAQTTSVASEADFQEGTNIIQQINTQSTLLNADKLTSAPNNANTGYSVQNATAPSANNSMKARQEGEKNSVVGLQTGVNNAVSMRQTGNVNGNQGDSGEANKIYSNQIGDGNDGRLEQQGDFNQTVLSQNNNGIFGSPTGTVGNKADIQQGVADQAEKNYASVQQSGDANEAKVLQTWDNSDAYVNQFGLRNKSEVNQQADPENSQGQEALVEQFGNDNRALINQTADGKKGRNYARVYSLGDNNQSQQTQETDSDTRGNKGLVNQGTTPNFISPLFNSAEYANIVAVDNLMNGGANIQSYYSQAIQDQKGHDNVAESHQFGDGTSVANGDYTKQVQDGEDNEAYAFQNAYGSPSGRGNLLDTYQEGDDNYVSTGQNGRRNDITVSQDGDDNYAISTQRGRDHIVDIRQTGDSNAAQTSQRGDTNSIVITQDGGQSWTAYQDVPGGMPNGGNSLDVLQVGPSTTLGTAGQTPGMVTKSAFTALTAPRAAGSL